MSNPVTDDRSSHLPESLFKALSTATRREILRFVGERSPAAVAKDDLAFRLAAVTNDKRLAAVTDDEHQRALVACHHNHLPALIDAGLLEERDDETVTATDHWLFDDPAFEGVLTGRAADDLDAVFEALADARRRTVLSVLATQSRPVSTETLAREVAAREAEPAERDASQRRVDDVRCSLVHVHLPRLCDADLVDYDADADRVSYVGHPDLRASWIEADRSGPNAVPDSDGESDAEDRSDSERADRDGDEVPSPAPIDGDVRTLEGRETIVTTGQSLCERADDELFMLITTTGLLEEGCFRRIEDALDRGVDVYLGSHDPRVRAVVRDRAPGVVLWEPQLDWLNLPPENQAVGRLVFADREAVLLGTIGTPDAATGEYAETAVLGDGPSNGLVVLMRQLLGSRLDHLDVRNERLRSETPL